MIQCSKAQGVGGHPAHFVPQPGCVASCPLCSVYNFHGVLEGASSQGVAMVETLACFFDLVMFPTSIRAALSSSLACTLVTSSHHIFIPS